MFRTSRINGRRLHVPRSFAGIVPVSPSWRRFTFEEPAWRGLARTLEPGCVAFDVGASYGVISTLIAQIAGHVVAFDANPAVFARAREIVASNRGADRVRFIQACVGQGSGAEVDFFVVAGRESVVSSRSRRVTELFPAAETIRVPTLALDDVPGPPPRVIKIDVEGGEYAVLEGAVTLVERHHPHLVIETHPRMMRDVAGSLPELCEWLVARDYGLVDLQVDEPIDPTRYVARYSNRPGYLLASTSAPGARR